MNTFGNIFRLTTFGESHGVGVGGVMDGFPAGVSIDMDYVQEKVDRRRPGHDRLSSQRNEEDRVEILSGVFEGVSTGHPIAFLIRNKDHHSEDYSQIRDVFRPSHADYTYQVKYGVRDYRGGGRSSARETVCRVVAGAFAELVLRQLGISITACIEDGQHLLEEIAKARAEGDTVGGVIRCVIHGCPAGLGEPVYGKLHAALGSAMLSINAVKGFEYGEGFGAAAMRGSEHNDAFCFDAETGRMRTQTNHSGGIQGGISNGEDIYFRVAFKPIATLSKQFPGRHDTCPVPRAVPIVEAMAAMVILDYYLLSKLSNIDTIVNMSDKKNEKTGLCH